MTDKIKPCPFCGHNPKLMTDNYEDKHVYWPQCLDPDCIMSESASTWPTKAAAIAAWNARAGAPAIDAGEVERLVERFERALDDCSDYPSSSIYRSRLVAARKALLEYIGIKEP